MHSGYNGQWLEQTILAYTVPILTSLMSTSESNEDETQSGP